MRNRSSFSRKTLSLARVAELAGCNFAALSTQNKAETNFGFNVFDSAAIVSVFGDSHLSQRTDSEEWLAFVITY